MALVLGGDDDGDDEGVAGVRHWPLDMTTMAVQR